MSIPFALIIEDDYDASLIFAEALQAAGFETEIIRSGDTALARLAATTPDAVVLDLHMPHVSGVDIMEQIRADERLAETQVIVATADPRLADTLQDDADLVLIKPISFSQLRDLAARLGSVISPQE
ncbi:MAG: response regulator [Anaerolineae bacterium]